jgi:hypothetical protein
MNDYSDYFPGAFNAPSAEMALDKVRKFDSGAVRDGDDGKYDYEGFLSPTVLAAFAEYMHGHRKLADGTYRASDNWQAGIPLDAYAKSLVRHMFDFWLIRRNGEAIRPESGESVSLKETLCAILFNAQGYLFELIREEQNADM